MNCKQGDLAIIVKSWAGNEGKIVRCVKFVGVYLWAMPDGSDKRPAPAWEVDCDLPNMSGEMGRLIMDEQLRPLRGDLLDDEETQVKELSRVE